MNTRKDDKYAYATRKSKVGVCPSVVFCPHCTQMVSKATFYRHQGLYKQSETESSSRSRSGYEQLHPTMSNSIYQLTNCYEVDHRQVDNEFHSVKGMESVSYCSAPCQFMRIQTIFKRCVYGKLDVALEAMQLNKLL